MENSFDFLKPDTLSFYLSENGLLHLRFKDEDMGRVSVVRMFPLKFAEEYISVRPETYSSNDYESEIGIIHSLSELEQAQADLVRNELKKRYFVPDILEVFSVKEEFGNTMWSVNTSAGKRDFTVTDMNSNVRNIGERKVMLTDVFGNRYCIPDIMAVDDKTMKTLEIWI